MHSKNIILNKTALYYFFICLINLTNGEKTSPYLNENLINLYSETNRFNLFLPKLNEVNELNSKNINLANLPCKIL